MAILLFVGSSTYSSQKQKVNEVYGILLFCTFVGNL